MLKRLLLLFIVGVITVYGVSCGGKVTRKINTDPPKEDRDKDLYTDSLRSLKRRHYEEGRLLLNTLISTYDNSTLLPVAKLLIADSFYREGGTSNLAQAEVEYREWLQFFPHHQLADDVLLKIAEIHVRQVDVPNRDWSQALSAERELVRLQKEYPQSDLNPQVSDYLKFVREQLGTHELNILKFYFDNRHAWNGVIFRGGNILKKYPEFTHTDEVLFLLGSALIEKEDTLEAGKYFSRLVREYPNSEYRDKAAKFLEGFGLPIPDPDPEAKTKVAERVSFFKRKKEEIFGAHISVSKEGIILTRDDILKPEIETLLNLPKVDITTPSSTKTATDGKVVDYATDKKSNTSSSEKQESQDN